MKYLFFFFITILSLYFNTGCAKDSMDSRPAIRDTSATRDTSIIPDTSDTTDLPVVNVPSNTPPVAHAGQDRIVWLPLDEAELSGSCTIHNPLSAVKWTKVSGPLSFTIENDDSLFTKITGLEAGVYQFELTVTDNVNLFDTDTIAVVVGDLPVNPNEVIFENLTWIFPWYNNVEIKDFVKSIPQGIPFRVFIQRDHDPNWIEVKPGYTQGATGFEPYDYVIIDWPSGMYTEGSLYISYYGSDVNDSPNVKIVF